LKDRNWIFTLLQPSEEQVDEAGTLEQSIDPLDIGEH